MHKLIELKEMLCRELEEYGERDNLDVGGLDVVDKLAHAIKNIDKIIEADSDSGRSYRERSYRYDDRGMRGRSNRRDKMGRYSTAVDDLQRLIDEAPDDHTRMELERMLQRYE